jgi:hypothetical protein
MWYWLADHPCRILHFWLLQKTYSCDCILNSSITSFLPYETTHILNLPYHRLSNKYFFIMIHLKFRTTYDNVQIEKKKNSRQLTVECHDWVTLRGIVVIPSQWESMNGIISRSLENIVRGDPSFTLACIKFPSAVTHIWGNAAHKDTTR